MSAKGGNPSKQSTAQEREEDKQVKKRKEKKMAIPLLRYGIDNNFPKFKEAIYTQEL